jgi:protein arginine N-methyltransferase 1
VYGLDFGVLKESALKTGYLAVPGASTVMTSTADVLTLDMQTIHSASEMLDRAIPFELKAKRTTTLDAFIAWFDYQFTKGECDVKVSTGPFAEPTHWKQTVFYLRNPVALEKGEVLNGTVTFEQYVRLVIFHLEQSY